MSDIVIGAGDMLDIACGAWRAAQGGAEIESREIRQAPDYAFDFSVFDGIDAARARIFVAFDERFGNFKRMEIMQAATERGLHLATIVSPGAVVAPDARLGPNVYVGAGAVVGVGAVIDYNVMIHAGAVIGYKTRLKASCWVEGGAVLGNGAEVGAHCTLRAGVVIAPRVRIGRYCEIGIPGLYRADIASRTVIDPRYDEPLVVHGA